MRRHYGRDVYTPVLRSMAMMVRAHDQPAFVPAAGIVYAFRPAPPVSGASRYNRFECGLDLNALLNTSPKLPLRGIWAAPGSPEAVGIGYMMMTAR